jgi:hypothetical protein
MIRHLTSNVVPSHHPGGARKDRPRWARRAIVAALTAGTLWLTAIPALAQSVKNGQVSGTLVSASAVGGDTIFTVPGDKAFVLTQWCSEDLRAFQLTAGNLIVPTAISAVGCAAYEPGVVIAPGTGITCTPTGAFSFGTHCLITGVLTVAR